MNVKKFLASTSREAWRLVREALGPDAVILSNRTVDGQVEILALPMEDMSSLAEPAVEKKPLSESTLAAFSAPKYRAESAAPQAPAARPAAARPQVQAAAQAQVQTPVQAQAEPPAQRMPAAEAAPAPLKDTAAIELAEVMSEIRTEVMGEIRSMRGMLEEQLAEIAWSGQQHRAPHKTLALREMLSAGFSASLARLLAEKLPSSEKPEEAMNWIRMVLGRNLPVMDNERDLLEKGGVYALVGPTGVGKTTTTAKLAARCVMKHGAGQLALITTDGYRIGAYEQLRIYGKILGVMVHSVKDETDLRIALDELKNKHIVLIDTVGVGQRDKMVAEQVAMLQGAGTEVKRLLCMSATATGETLNEVVRSYLGGGLAGCIVTKLDEAATIGNVLDVVIRQKLKVYYVANGQRVPEDLHVVNRNYLVDRAFKLKRETAAYQLKDEELPLVVANTARAMNDKALREVKVG
ncbi:flagellar biosynthesis protein FlhF [Noviherbaspirillum sp. UKPF54]|uniref:flagellar biosynthesis protein FlhF n=1 Tax=Noviherbaspirillum sp. UKPF54 TaxID=2601898 RepID=UPI0011B17F11|nr:flagellar biosynthesis protein FlhF [Noviherbaspirillum sp. UKPF54]QDZ28137.1 flagellar biosynthesis protein FlhF [Noviherbaspirillum sp. UKPF54]